MGLSPLFHLELLDDFGGDLSCELRSLPAAPLPNPNLREEESLWRGWLELLLPGKTVLVCFLGSLVSHCPVFPPWLWSHWPLFGDILPQEPSLALPSPSPPPVLPDTFWERTQIAPSHLLGCPRIRSPSLPHSFRGYALSTDCARHRLGIVEGPDSVLRRPAQWGREVPQV